MGSDIKSLIWLILALALVFYLTWLTTRFVGNKSRGRQTGRHMQVLDRLALSGDKQLLIVRIAGRCSVLSVAGHEIRLLRHLTDEEAAAFAVAPRSANPAATGPVLSGFAGLWQAFRRQARASFGWSAAQEQELFDPRRDQARGYARSNMPDGAEDEETPIEADEEEMLEQLERRVRERRQAGRR